MKDLELFLDIITWLPLQILKGIAKIIEKII